MSQAKQKYPGAVGYTSFQCAFAVLIKSWSHDLVWGPSLIVAQYTGENTEHICEYSCDEEECIRKLSLPRQLLASFKYFGTFHDDLNASDGVLNASDYLLDFIVDRLMPKYKPDPHSSIHYRHEYDWLYDYCVPIMTALFTRRREQLAIIVNVPQNYLSAWRQADIFQGYCAYVSWFECSYFDG
ncbi:MAG: hypothetical protein Faunusvirus8_22 [Faunusvirus sp.]|jgi:hypothetical protein|uniref:Uncharacterized protein n=1 Tax=Faunusvirus sp. TaxID=2487766 RepID=A0A3G4ZWP0_9VIRU|nr:MAG: hypothetical protein Faunusvirus8_22 [Faunusvirus sp.]